ncbi:SIMPL domain-containing protein [Haliea sp. E1-2-M8]|uniref:SIMPL domain-containing protein n=1 Tax=Haliea sp. E1-2-M8 TaxID=3064706 RepID=UPI002716434F|nr:SIMPL domain-containing protein [Haliea sp. E1-2-M8]MDO8862939.1 SIMPL domain-containing protein [Haliea sp. E1-2-M8]
MKTTIPKTLGLCALLLMGAAGVQAGDADPQPQIRVTGEGQATLVPDMAMLQLMVTREGASAREALDANSAAMQEVLAAMHKSGIAERDLQTAQFSIQPRYRHHRPEASGQQEPPAIVGYTVSNSLTVRVRDLDQVGAILDRSVSLGVNQGGSIEFLNDDPAPALEQARVAAVKNALQRAATLTAAAGVKTGHILEISEQSYQPRPMPMARTEMMMSADAGAVPIAGGENTYSVTVNLTLALEQ